MVNSFVAGDGSDASLSWSTSTAPPVLAQAGKSEDTEMTRTKSTVQRARGNGSSFTGISITSPQASVNPRRRLRIGTLWIDVLNFAEALREIEILVETRRGGAVYTPNVDHVLKAEFNEAFRRAYEHASLSLADGMPLVWAAGLLGCPLPGRVAGSDLLVPLLEMAARRQWRVYLLGGAPGVAKAAATLLSDDLGVCVAGWDDCLIGKDGSDVSGDSIARARASKPDLILVALGPPKQELWIRRSADAVRPAVLLGIGAGLS